MSNSRSYQIHPISITSSLPPLTCSTSTIQPVHKSSLINTVFSHAFPVLWKALPPLARAQPSLEFFKRHLKTHLFRTPAWSQDNEDTRRLRHYAHGAALQIYYYYYCCSYYFFIVVSTINNSNYFKFKEVCNTCYLFLQHRKFNSSNMTRIKYWWCWLLKFSHPSLQLLLVSEAISEQFLLLMDDDNDWCERWIFAFQKIYFVIMLSFFMIYGTNTPGNEHIICLFEFIELIIL